MIYSGRKGEEKSTQEPRKSRDSGPDWEEKQQSNSYWLNSMELEFPLSQTHSILYQHKQL